MANPKIARPDPVYLMGFYRPHTREETGYTGLLVNQNTGELARPIHRVKQEFREECDINNIIKQYKLTGQIQHINAQAKNGSYQDLPDPIDYQESLAITAQAASSFATLPAHVRDRFSNDPSRFLDFMSNPENRPEMERLGLVKAKSQPTQVIKDPPVPAPITPVKEEIPPQNK